MLTTLPSRGEERAPGQMPRLLLSPAPGLHLLRHRGRWLWITLERERAENAQRGGRAPRETLTIQLLGRDREVLRELARDAYEAARSSEQAGIHVHAIKWEGWSRVATKAPRPASSVVLPAGVFEALAEDLRIFRAARDWYGEMGIPWKRGYLLHGPPGNGKSSLVLALATLIDAGLYYLNLANSEVSDESLPTLLAEVPGGSIVLIEEVDTLFEQREAKRADVKLTFGGLLNALDGPTAQEGLVVVMTTNHLERLDPALVRPGRIDVRTHLGNAAPEQARRLFRRFFPDAPAPLERRAGEAVASG
jgi:chaperone BCS1